MMMMTIIIIIIIINNIINELKSKIDVKVLLNNFMGQMSCHKIFVLFWSNLLKFF